MPRRARKHADIEPNLTSLIDVTFLLIVFFVLVSHLNEVEAVELDLPRPTEPSTVQPEAEHQVAISMVPAAEGQVGGYRVGEKIFTTDKQGLDLLTAHLASLYRQNPQININLRADRVTRFQYIEPALQAVSMAARSAQSQIGIAVNPRINLMVVHD